MAALAVGLLLISSSASAVSIVTYDYTATLTPLELNSDDPVPSTSTATGSFSYDSDQPLGEGMFPLTAFTFDPADDTEAGFFDCSPIGDCTVYGGIPSVFNPQSEVLQVSLQYGMSYYVTHYISSASTNYYSDGGASGEWVINSLSVTNGVPEPTTVTLFGLGLAGLGALRRKKLAM
jgi:hypothetical protein